MRNTSIEQLAYVIKEAKKKNKPQPIFFLGAGASKSGKIPLANDIIKDILLKYSDSLFIKELMPEEKTYPRLMECLMPIQRDELLKGYINRAKINVTHIYLAQLVKEGYADYVLTVNFDNLMLRALALFNEFPSTYDMAILKDLTTTTFKEKSVIYLHGQHHGLWLLNTVEEMKKVHATVPRIFDSIKNERPWIFIGYSGDDPIFEHIRNLGRFDNGLFWVTYNDTRPSDKIQSFLDTENINSHLITGFDADAFMLKLNVELELDQPLIVDKPFTSIKVMLDNIVDIDEAEHFKGVKQRLEIAKSQIGEAIKQYEEGKMEIGKDVRRTSELNVLKKEIINLLIKRTYNEEDVDIMERRAAVYEDSEINELIANLYTNLGSRLIDKARGSTGNDIKIFCDEALSKIQKAAGLSDKIVENFNNWGVALILLAKQKSGVDAERLFKQAFSKYELAIKTNPNYSVVYYNWGTDLSELATLKNSEESVLLYNEAFQKYEQAIKINPNYSAVFFNWGADLLALAKLKNKREAEQIYIEAFEKLKRAEELGEKSYNLACLYALKQDKKNALKTLEESLNNKEVTIDYVKHDDDWINYHSDIDYLYLLNKFDTQA